MAPRAVALGSVLALVAACDGSGRAPAGMASAGASPEPIAPSAIVPSATAPSSQPSSIPADEFRFTAPPGTTVTR